MDSDLKKITVKHKQLRDELEELGKIFERIAKDCKYRTTRPRPITGTERACSWHQENTPHIKALMNCQVDYCWLQYD